MRKKRRYFAVILCLALCCAMLCGCESYDNFRAAFIDPPEAQQVIKIGVYEPITGTDANDAKDEIAGIELAHELYPEIDGIKLELVYGDIQSDLDRAKEVATSLAEQGCSVVLGSHGSVYALAGGDIFRELEIPMIAPTNTNPILTETNEYCFRAAIVEQYQSNSIAYYIRKYLKQTGATVLYCETDDTAAALAEQFKTAFSELTANEECVVIVKYEEGTEDFSSYFSMIELTGNSVIYFPGSAEEGDRLIRLATEYNGNPWNWVGTSQWDGIETVDNGTDDTDRSYLRGISYVVDYDANEDISEMTTVLREAYAQKYGADAVPSDAVALGFDSYLLAREAIHLAGGSSLGSDICKALYQIEDLMGATGSYTIDSNGDPYKEVIFERYVDGQFNVVYTAPISGGTIK